MRPGICDRFIQDETRGQTDLRWPTGNNDEYIGKVSIPGFITFDKNCPVSATTPSVWRANCCYPGTGTSSMFGISEFLTLVIANSLFCWQSDYQETAQTMCMELVRTSGPQGWRCHLDNYNILWKICIFGW